MVPAYTLKPSDVEITVLDNKRYTMRDIGKIDRRVNTSRILYITIIIRKRSF